ncbi:MAG: Trk family potassium uptake protein [Candidatus Omnitrophica bacterium]|nr:Trk family potassium uptake protein [Candidatus Omnitrophota bacterium]
MLRKLNPPQVVAVSFLTAIVIGAVLLNSPFAVKGGERLSLIDSLFTATSATCVTGLIVKDTGSYFSGFGKGIIFVLIQIGGLGIMTFSTLFAIIFGRKLTIKEDIVIQRTIAPNKVQNLSALIKYILAITFGIEILGAACLALRWWKVTHWSAWELAVNSAFHAVSAFCNAGFSLFSNSFTSFAEDPYINFVMAILIVTGGIGFIVILEIFHIIKRDMKPHNRLTIQAKTVLSVTAFLIFAGAISLFFIEKNNAMTGLSTKGKILSSVFQSVTTRTAGFNTINIASLTAPAMWIIIFLMFIGASPGSTGGGIKTCTFGVILATVFSMLKNRDRVSLFKKTVPKEVVRKSLLVFFLAVSWIFVAVFLLALVEYNNAKFMGNFFLKIIFETTSAFGTVGLSTGITPLLSTTGKLIIIATMFVGRVGPLTLALAVALQTEKGTYVYPEEKIMIG